MRLATYLRKLEPEEREKFARRIRKRLKSKTSVSYLYVVAGGHRDPSTDLAIAIEVESADDSDGGVTRSELLPEVWPPAPALGRAKLASASAR